MAGTTTTPCAQFCAAVKSIKSFESFESFEALFIPCVDALFSGTTPAREFRLEVYEVVQKMCTQPSPNNFSGRLYEFVVALADSKAGAWDWAGSESAEAWERGAAVAVPLFSYLDKYYCAHHAAPTTKEVFANARAKYEKK
jgi:hypothetical protein